MVTPFDCLGFAPLDAEGFGTLLDTAAEAGEDLTAPGGAYVCWSPKPSVELWVQVGKKDELFGMNPHFHGDARATAEFVRVHASASNPLEGALELRLGGVSIVADAPDLARVRHRVAVGTTISVQLTLFCASMQVEPSAPKNGLVASAKNGDGSVGVGGIVRRAEVREGLDTPFHHCVVEMASAPGTTWDIVFPASIPLPSVESYVTCRGWSSVRVEL